MPSPSTPPLPEITFADPSRTASLRAAALLDAIPGGLAWSALLLVVIGAAIAPLTLLAAVALLACYSALRFILAAVAHGHGLRLIRQWERIDWQTTPIPDASIRRSNVHHLIIIPNYNEPAAVLERTLDHLSAHASAQKTFTVVLAMEAAESNVLAKANALQHRYESAFAHMIVTVHPTNLPGEMRCKSANLAWAVRHARHTLISEYGYSRDHLIVTTMDADTLWHPRYFESLTTLFARDPNRYSTIWQAPLRYHAKVWESHPLLRILHAYASAWELAYLAAPWWQALPMSSYSLSVRLLEESGGWDTAVIADEWHMAITSFFRRQGDLHVQPIFLPLMVQPTTGTTWRAALFARYRQTFRHAWGAKEIGYTVAQMHRSPETPRWKALELLLRVAHDNLLAGAGWIVMFLGAQLPLLLHPGTVTAHLDSASILLLQGALLVVSLLTIVFWWLDVRLRPAPPAPRTWQDRLTELASLPLVAVLTVIGMALPLLHAQTWLMLGKSIEFRVTPKT